MRILFVSFVGDNEWSGMGRWSHRMAAELASLGHNPTLWFADEFPALRARGRLAVLLVPLVLAARLVRRRHDFDVVVAHEPLGFWYGLLRWLWRVLPPLVAMCHNVESKVFKVLQRAAGRGLAVPPPGNRWKAPLFRLWQSDGAIRMADHVVCLSSEDRAYVSRCLGRPECDTALQINGVSEADFVDRREHAGGRRVLFVGGWLDVKGRRVLPRVWSRVRARLPDARLRLVGTAWDANVVLADFAAQDRESVEVIPRVTHPDEMTQQFAEHDLFVMPSLSEGSPLSLLEALAAGIPVVASRVGGIPDIVIDGEHALLFDPDDPSTGADRVCAVLTDPVLAEGLRRAGQTRARGCTWAASAAAMEAAVRTAVTCHIGRTTHVS